MRPIPTSLTPGPRHSIAISGDSLTENQTLLVPQHQMWPAVLQSSLRSQGARVRSRNLARNGRTTTQMSTAKANLTYFDVPKVYICFGGVNDPGNSIVGATTQANIEAMIAHCFAAGTQYAVVVSTQYLNWSSGGDTINTPGSTYATLRTFQQAAVTAKAVTYPGRVAYCDLYTYMRALIVAGTYTQGDFAWHTADSNQHLNAIGQAIVADAVLATITAQTGWLDDLKKG